MQNLPSVFRVADARDRGVEEKRLRAKDGWSRPFRGMRASAGAQWIDIAGERARAAGAVLFGPSALRAWGLELPGRSWADDEPIHLAVPRPERAPRGEGIAGYSVGLDPQCVTHWSGVRLTTRARTWVDLARSLSVPHLVAVGDGLCRLDESWCTVPELTAALALSPRVRGIALLREALELIVPGAESYPESQVRVAFEQAGLPRAAVNAEIRQSGQFVARVDLLFAEYGVIVEYEGAHHAESKTQWRRDLTRFGVLQQLGYIVERAHAGDLIDPSDLIGRVRAHLVARGWHPSPAPRGVSDA